MEKSQSMEIRYSAVVAELDVKPEFVSIVGGKTLPANRIVSLNLYFFQTWPASRLLDFTYHILECKSTDVAAEAHPFVFHLIPVFSPCGIAERASVNVVNLQASRPSQALP